MHSGHIAVRKMSVRYVLHGRAPAKFALIVDARPFTIPDELVMTPSSRLCRSEVIEKFCDPTNAGASACPASATIAFAWMYNAADSA